MSGGAEITYKLDPEDLARLLAGLKQVGRIYLAAGAKRVMPATFSYHSFPSSGRIVRGP